MKQKIGYEIISSTPTGPTPLQPQYYGLSFMSAPHWTIS